MNRFTCFIILLICIAATVHADGGQLHCGERGPVDPYATQISLQGPPGKAGPPGPQAVVDYSIVTLIIDAKIKEVAQENTKTLEENTKLMFDRLETMINDSIASMRETITAELIKSRRKNSAALTELRSEIQSVKTGLEKVLSREELCNVSYNGICFFTVIHDIWDMNFTDAEAICVREGARVADIYSKTHYKMLVELVRPKVDSFTIVWTGLRANPATGELFLRNGDKAPFVDWTIGFPRSTPSRKNVHFHIKKEPDESLDGMINERPSANVHGVICQLD